MGFDWQRWHRQYDHSASPLSERLDEVRRRVRQALDGAASGTIRVLSMCAGDGRDVLPVVAAHARGADVVGRLVELDGTLAERAREAAPVGFDVVQGDAADLAHYADVAPAHLVLVCGVFGNISNDDVERTVRTLPMLTSAGGTVVWTRHRKEPDLTTSIRRWLADEGFVELSFASGSGNAPWGVGSARFEGTPRPWDPNRSPLFRFLR